MIPLEVAVLRDILLKEPNVTNSEVQATRWAFQIIAAMQKAGYVIERIEADARS